MLIFILSSRMNASISCTRFFISILRCFYSFSLITKELQNWEFFLQTFWPPGGAVGLQIFSCSLQFAHSEVSWHVKESTLIDCISRTYTHYIISRRVLEPTRHLSVFFRKNLRWRRVVFVRRSAVVVLLWAEMDWGHFLWEQCGHWSRAGQWHEGEKWTDEPDCLPTVPEVPDDSAISCFVLLH